MPWAVCSAVLADRRVGELPASWVEDKLQVLDAVERVKAWADSRALAALRRLHEAVREQCRHLDDDRAAMAGPRAGLTPTALRHESRTAAVDEVVLATGLSEAQVTRRLDLALDEDGRASMLLGALDSGEVGLDRALRVHHDTRGIGPEETRAICTRLLARNADGSVCARIERSAASCAARSCCTLPTRRRRGRRRSPSAPHTASSRTTAPAR